MSLPLRWAARSAACTAVSCSNPLVPDGGIAAGMKNGENDDAARFQPKIDAVRKTRCNHAPNSLVQLGKEQRMPRRLCNAALNLCDKLST